MPYVQPKNYEGFDGNGNFAPPVFGGTLACMIGAFDYTDTDNPTLFTLPAGAVPIDWLIDIGTDFNAGTDNNLDIGLGTDADYFALNVAIGTQGLYRAGASGTVFGRLGGTPLTEDTAVTVDYKPSGTAAGTGAARLIMWYILLDN